MNKSKEIRFFDLSYIDQEAKEMIGDFVRISYKIAEINGKLAKSKVLYEETRLTIHQNAALEERDVSDNDMYEISKNQVQFFQEKLEFQKLKDDYNAELMDIFIYFFDDATENAELYKAYFDRAGQEGQFRSLFIDFFANINCINLDNEHDIWKDRYIRNFYHRIYYRTRETFLDNEAFIVDGQLKVFDRPLAPEKFFKIFLWVIAEELKKQEIVVYDYSEDALYLSQPKHREKLHDFTNEKYFKEHYINVYGNIIKKCTHEEHDTESITATVEDLYTEENYEIEMEYCPKCGEYFMYSSDISWLREQGLHRNPKLRYNPVRTQNLEGDTNSKSVLKLYGYSVGYSGCSSYVREKIISALIKKEVAKASELSGLIYASLLKGKGRDADMDYAIECWEKDLQFIEDNF